MDGCDERVHGAGLCETHYRRKRRGAALDAPLKTIRPELDRWLSLVDRSGGAQACWPWIGTKTHDGYGMFRVGSRTDGSRAMVLGHRWGYEHFVGAVPDGLELDHVRCDDPGCANPAHVRPRTHRSNTLRSTAPQAVNAAKTHCPKGHAYDAANTYRWPGAKGSSRQCRTCKRGGRAA